MTEIVKRPEAQLPATLEDLSKFVLVGREKLVAVRAEIRAIEKVGLAQAVREQKLKEGQAISEAVLDAEVRIGQLMREVPKAKGGQPYHKKSTRDSGVASKNVDNDVTLANSQNVERTLKTVTRQEEATPMKAAVDNKAIAEKPEEKVISSKTEEPRTETQEQPKTQVLTKAEIIRQAGFTPKQVQRFQTMAEHPEIVEQAKQEARENEDIVSRSLVLNKIKQAKREAEIQRQVEDIERQVMKQPDGLFDVIVMDPPWHYGTSYDASGRRCANPYPEMTQEQLKAIKLPASNNCVLFLWTTHKFIWDAKELMDKWGFEYRNILVWDKKVMGMGNLFRMRCEFCLVGIKGKPVFKDVHNLEDIIEEKRREHSRKPEAFYELVQELCTGRKLDYFSRTEREGWVCYGNDTEKFRLA